MTTRRTVRVDLGPRAYDVHISPDGIDGLSAVARSWAGRGAAIVTDDHVDPLYGEATQEALRAAGVDARRLVLPAGERTKSFDHLRRLLGDLLDVPIHRDGVVFALGGGVVGDLAGMAASLLRRGVALVQVPTSVIAQVDSAVGGKTAINAPQGKNLVGTFHQPAAVYAVTPWLATLPREELRAGLAEVVKYAMLDGVSMLDGLESDLDDIRAVEPHAMAALVERCVSIKARIVEDDETEAGSRRWLNLGHTLGHAVEAASGYGGLRHGEAVSIGLVAAATLSQRRGWLRAEDVDRVRSLLQRLDLPVRSTGLDRAAVRRAMAQDKKAGSGGLSWVLLRGFGVPTVVRRETADIDGDLDYLVKKGLLEWETP